MYTSLKSWPLWPVILLATLFLSACSAAPTSPTPSLVPATSAPIAASATAAPMQPTAAPVLDSTFTPQPGSRGAATPWVEYEAEAGVTNGETLAASRTFGAIAAE